MKKQKIALNNILYQNPVLTYALGISTVVAVATTFYNGLVLSLLIAWINIPVCILSALFYRKWARPYRTLATALTAAVFYTLGVHLLSYFPASIPTLFQYYLPLAVANSLMFNRAVRRITRRTVREATVDILSASLGYGLTACVVGAIRELLKTGAIAGWVWFHPIEPFHMAQAPFFGFIVLGFIAALARSVRLRHDRKKQREGGRFI